MKRMRIIKTVFRFSKFRKMRSILSVISISFGIASVIILSAIGSGAGASLSEKIAAVGSNLITIDAAKVREVTGRSRQAEKAVSLKETDIESILLGTDESISIAPTQERSFYIKYGDASTNCRVIGTVPDYLKIRNYSVERGRCFDGEENSASSRVAVVGHKIVENLFDGIDPLGEIIRINNVRFEIVGVLASKGASYDGANEDEVILIPLKTGMRRMFNVDYLKNIYVQVRDKEKMNTVQYGIRTILRECHNLNAGEKEDDFTMRNSYTVIRAEEENMESFSVLSAAVSWLVLLIGGGGILALMLLSVKERTTEIGLRIALGACTSDILIQFILESLLLSLSGGISGILLGICGSLLTGKITDMRSVLTAGPIVLSVSVSIMLGVIFGVYPAWKASRIQPVRALQK